MDNIVEYCTRLVTGDHHDCRRGWIVSELDTVYKCPFCRVRGPHPENDGDGEWAQWIDWLEAGMPRRNWTAEEWRSWDTVKNNWK